MPKCIYALLCTALLFAQAAFAAETTSFNFSGCVDSRERAVASQADASLPVLLETRLVEGNRVIVYNPSLLPQLLPETRAFLYAHECAWTRLGMPIDQTRTAEQARRADCWAVEILSRSKIIKNAATLAAIESDLALAAGSAEQLPGPARELKLAACSASKALKTTAKGSVVQIDSALPEASPAWNTCMQTCGNVLFACGRAKTCTDRFDQCIAACGTK